MNAGELLIEQGREQGREEGREEVRAQLRTAIEQVLRARSLVITEMAAERIASCRDVGLLAHWLGRATFATSEEEVFES
jgi:predicted transposase YdaD